MSKIEREMIAEARAARQRQDADNWGMSVISRPLYQAGQAAKNKDVADFVDAIGADVPSAPNDEQADETPWWQYAHVLGHVPPLCQEADAPKARSAVEMLECHGWRWEHGAWQVPNA